MAAPLVLILYNKPLLPRSHPDAESEHSIVVIAGRMAKILGLAGFRISPLGLKRDPLVLWRELRRQKPAVVFNLFEGHADDADSESHVAGLLQWSGIPYTGSPPRALTVARDKDLTKQLLRGAGLPTADFFVVSELPVARCPLDWPVIVKPARQDGSVGLAQSSVCVNQRELQGRVEFLLDNYGAPVLVEEYIAGREFNVALVELPKLRALPPSEIMFPTGDPDSWPILTYDGKWTRGSEEFEQTPNKYPADISRRLGERLAALAKDAYRLIGCRDYARVDFRVKPGGKPYILEVNPNPEISPDAGFGGCLGSAAIPYDDFVVRLVEHATSRVVRQVSTIT